MHNHVLKPAQPAPDFEAEGYYEGDKIKIHLSDYQGQWVLLFFYSSDFTFV